MAIEKTSKVVKAQRTESDDWTTKDGKKFYAFTIEMENGDKGTFQLMKSVQEVFVEGEEVEYEINGIKGKDGTIFKYSIKPSNKYRKDNKGSYQWDEVEELKANKANAVGNAINTIDYLLWDSDRFNDITKKYLAFLIEKCSDRSTSISAKAALSRAVEMTKINKTIDDEDKIIDAAKKLFDYFTNGN